MLLVETILSKLYHENIYANINIPVMLSTLEQETFTEYLETIVKANQFLRKYDLIDSFKQHYL